MSIIFRYPRRPAWLYPEHTILETKYGQFEVRYEAYKQIGLPTPSPHRVWRHLTAD